MIILYSANTLPGELVLPSTYVDQCRPEDLAELAACDHWRDHPNDTPTLVTVVHLIDVDGYDLGLFEVRCEQRPVFTASPMGPVGKGGAWGVSLAATLPTAPVISN